MRTFFLRLLPFLFLGVMIVVLAAGIILLSYLLILGAIVGVILFLIAWLREKFFLPRESQLPTKRRPRTFEQKGNGRKT